MILLIIVSVLLLACIVWLLSGRWKVTTDIFYLFDENGKDKIEAHKLQEWNRDNPNEAVVKKLKELYPDEYKSTSERYAKLKDVLYYLDCKKLPCKIVTKKRIQRASYWDECEKIGPWVCTCIVGVVLTIMVGFVVGCKCEWAVQTKEAEIEEKIVLLENNKQYITTYYSAGVTKDIDISSTNIPSVIKEHNAEVEELIRDIRKDQINLNNPWCNVWVNPACKKFSNLTELKERIYINRLGE